jgi:pyrroline-5-carboxylate reductase
MAISRINSCVLLFIVSTLAYTSVTVYTFTPNTYTFRRNADCDYSIATTTSMSTSRSTTSESMTNIIIGNNDANTRSVSIGFIGCGAIASAIATGLANQSRIPIDKIVVTRRSESKSRLLQSKFPNLVSVCDCNQDVVDQADIIFVTVLPDQTSSVLQELSFNQQRHLLVSLVSTSKLESLCLDSKLPLESVYKMICLPAVAYNEGVCLLQVPTAQEAANQQKNDGGCPCSPLLLHDLLETLGGVVKVKTDRQMSAMMVPSGLMGCFYGLLRNNRDWLIQNGSDLSTDAATNLVLRYYSAMIQDALRATTTESSQHPVLDQLIAEQTPGGLNEQALANAEAFDVFQSYNKLQDAMFLRILGESDGSL